MTIYNYIEPFLLILVGVLITLAYQQISKVKLWYWFKRKFMRRRGVRILRNAYQAEKLYLVGDDVSIDEVFMTEVMAKCTWVYNWEFGDPNVVVLDAGIPATPIEVNKATSTIVNWVTKLNSIP